MADASDTIRIADKTTVTQQMAVNSDGSINATMVGSAGTAQQGTGAVSTTTTRTTEAKSANVDDAADITLNSGSETSLGAAPAGTVARVLSSKDANTANIRIGKTGQVGASRGIELVPGATLIWPGTATLYGYAGSTGQIITQAFVVD